MGGQNPFNLLPQEMWEQIFYHVPHVTCLQSRCVSVQWNCVLLDVEAKMRPRSPCCLALERLGEESKESKLNWKVFVSNKETKVKLSFPPGWTLGLHGGIQGGGPCRLVAFWDRSAKVYWVGSPVHDKWEKVPKPCAFNHLQFKVQGFHLVGEEKSGFYKLLQFQLNISPCEQKPIWVVQVYSSRSRTWKTEETTAEHYGGVHKILSLLRM